MEREASRKHAITNYLAAMYAFTGIGRFNKQELDTELYPLLHEQTSKEDLKAVFLHSLPGMSQKVKVLCCPGNS